MPNYDLATRMPYSKTMVSPYQKPSVQHFESKNHFPGISKHVRTPEGHHPTPFRRPIIRNDPKQEAVERRFSKQIQQVRFSKLNTTILFFVVQNNIEKTKTNSFILFWGKTNNERKKWNAKEYV